MSFLPFCHSYTHTYFDLHSCLTSNAPNNHTKDNRTPLRHSVGDYYIKPLAVWVPHLIIPGHVPVCPHCHDTKGVYDEIYGNMVRFVCII